MSIDHFTARNAEDGGTVIAIGVDTDGHTAGRLARGVARLIDVLDVTWGKDEELEEPPRAPGACGLSRTERERCQGTR